MKTNRLMTLLLISCFALPGYSASENNNKTQQSQADLTDYWHWPSKADMAQIGQKIQASYQSLEQILNEQLTQHPQWQAQLSGWQIKAKQLVNPIIHKIKTQELIPAQQKTSALSVPTKASQQLVLRKISQDQLLDPMTDNYEDRKESNHKTQHGFSNEPITD